MTTQPDPAEEINESASKNQGDASAPSAEAVLARREEDHPEPAANNGGANQGRKHWLEYATAGFAFVAALGSISAVIVGYWQWGIMQEGNSINRESFGSVQRAFVTFQEIEMT